MSLTINHNFLRNTDTSDDPTKETIDKYKKNHPSTTCINKHTTNSEISFYIQPVT